MLQLCFDTLFLSRFCSSKGGGSLLCLVLLFFFLNSQLGVVLLFVIVAFVHPEATLSSEPFFFVLPIKKMFLSCTAPWEVGDLVMLCLDPLDWT